MPYRISYERFKGHRQVVGKDPTAKANGWKNELADFETKEKAKKYKEKYSGLFKGKKAKIYKVKSNDSN
jgi:hypothetical protein